MCYINSTLVTHAILQILGHPHICFKRRMSTGACFLVFGQLATGRGWLGNRRQEEERKMKGNRGRVPEGHAPSQYSKLTEVDEALPLRGSLSGHCWNIELLGPHGCNRQVWRWKQLSVCHCWACESQEYWAFSETKSRAGKCYCKGHCSLLFSPELGKLRPDNGYFFSRLSIWSLQKQQTIAVTHFLSLFKTPHHTLCFPFFVEIIKASLNLNYDLETSQWQEPNADMRDSMGVANYRHTEGFISTILNSFVPVKDRPWRTGSLQFIVCMQIFFFFFF